MSWWVGAYIEAGAGTSGSSTPYLPFVFQAATKAQAQTQAGAKLLAGPFPSQSAAQTWANNYEKNPSTPHAGSGLTPGTGTTTGDNPPAAINPLSWVATVSGFHANNFFVRALKVIVGGVLLIVGIAKMTGTEKAVLDLTTKVTGKAVSKLPGV